MAGRGILRWLPLAAFGLVFVVFLISLETSDPSAPPTQLAGKPVPVFSLPDLAGGAPLTHADLLRDGPVVLNIWASWCGPCRLEHPHLMALARDNVPVYGINYKDDPAAAKRFLGALGDPFVKTGVDRSGVMAVDLGVFGVPETFLIDRDGTIILRHAGPLDAAVLRDSFFPKLRPSGKETRP